MSDRIVISCMDRRLNQKLEQEYNDGNTIFVRNAGGCPSGAKNTLKRLMEENEVKEIVILPHTDCGAMGAVFKCMKEGEKFDAEVTEKLVKNFEGKFLHTRKQLEFEENPRQCLEEMKSIGNELPKYDEKVVGISVKLVELQPTAHQSSTDNVIVLMSPSTAKYSNTFLTEMNHSYCIQADIEDSMASVKLATAANGLKLAKIYITETNSVEQKKMLNAITEFKAKLGLGQLQVFLVESGKVTNVIEAKKKIKG
ncbi:MAG: hypothetical protein KGH53_01550 [Candidatus Micrarchaeota archaeon]|nr:hypothetical protein [Candidatus Micrarchaeota archaeon]